MTEPQTTYNGRPAGIDYTYLMTRRAPGEPEPMVVEDLFPLKAIIAITGEEGEGKSMLTRQLVCQLAREEPVFGMFQPGICRPRWTLVVDTEQGMPDEERLGVEMAARGLAPPAGTITWLESGGLDLSGPDDQAYLEHELVKLGTGGLLVLDTGTNATSDPNDLVSVRDLFNFVSRLMQTYGLVGCVVVLHPRKRMQGEHGREFDDLFGSREWKGRPTKALYIEGGRITCWKDRGWHLRRRWGIPENRRYPQAVLERLGWRDPGAVPFRITLREDHQAAEFQATRWRAVQLVRENPDELSKTALAKRLGGRYEEARDVVRDLLKRGVIGPDKDGAKLSVLSSEGLGTAEDESAGRGVPTALELPGIVGTGSGAAGAAEPPAPLVPEFRSSIGNWSSGTAARARQPEEEDEEDMNDDPDPDRRRELEAAWTRGDDLAAFAAYVVSREGPAAEAITAAQPGAVDRARHRFPAWLPQDWWENVVALDEAEAKIGLF